MPVIVQDSDKSGSKQRSLDFVLLFIKMYLSKFLSPALLAVSTIFEPVHLALSVQRVLSCVRKDYNHVNRILIDFKYTIVNGLMHS